MADVLLRRTLEQTYGKLDFSAGLTRAFRKIQPDRPPAAFPFRSTGQILHALQWPPSGAFRQVAVRPNSKRNAWSDETQGVTHDASHWFITTQNKTHKGATDNKLWKIPVTMDLNQDFSPTPPSVRVRGMPLELSAYDHFSDLDHHDGRLYVAISGPGQPGLVAQFSADDLSYLGSGRLSAQGEKAPWCAVNPRTGHIYSSVFEEATRVHIYRPVYTPTGGLIDLEHLGDLLLRTRDGGRYTLRNVQGGMFSPSGHLYLVSDVKKNGGIRGFDAVSGTIRRNINIKRRTLREFEGVTFWDLNKIASGGVDGTIHMLELTRRWIQTDKVSMRHFDVDAQYRAFI